jgi:1,2-dihydroxy-3-keto-5-methylthiopentene dioxygenase
MRAFYFDNIPGDQRLLHDSGNAVSDEILKSTGVLHWHIPTSQQNQIDAVAEERNYKNRDTITITKQGLGDLYEAKLKSFYEEYALLSQHCVCTQQQLEYQAHA